METKTKIVIIYGAVFFTLIVFLSAWIIFSQKNSSQGQAITPSTFPTITITQSVPLKVLQTSLPDGSIVNSNSVTVTFTFDRTISSTSVPITIIPSADFTSNVSGSALSIQLSSLIAGESYEIRLRLNGLYDYNSIYSFHFSTTGPTPTLQPNTYDPKLQQSIQTDLITNHPDVFLAGKVPYTGSDFSVSTSFVSGSPSGHWGFTVQSTGPDPTQSKNDFISWAESLGLTSDQINNLDITYQ